MKFEEMKEKIPEYEYALLYMISEIKLYKIEGNKEKLKNIDWEQCQEARFFSKDKEMHFFKDEDSFEEDKIREEKGFKIVSVTDEDDIHIKNYEDDMYIKNCEEDTHIKKFRLANGFQVEIGPQQRGKNLQVKEYLAYDEDGQVYVAMTRLQGIAEEV